jgi:hypothetical protein
MDWYFTATILVQLDLHLVSHFLKSSFSSHICGILQLGRLNLYPGTRKTFWASRKELVLDQADRSLLETSSVAGSLLIRITNHSRYTQGAESVIKEHQSY